MRTADNQSSLRALAPSGVPRAGPRHGAEESRRIHEPDGNQASDPGAATASLRQR